MAQAYEWVDWNFLRQVLKAFDFSTKSCKLIFECVETPWFLIMMNETFICIFKSKRGHRQGDPLFPYLFVLMKEFLSRLLKKYFREGHIGTFYHPRGAPLIPHLLYAYDLLVFTNWEKCSLKKLLKTLEMYEAWSGEKVNKEKLEVYMSKKLRAIEEESLSDLSILWKENFLQNIWGPLFFREE